MKYYLKYVFILLALSLSACSSDSGSSSLSLSTERMTAPIPSSFKITDIGASNFRVQVRIDGADPVDCTDLEVNAVDNTYSCQLSINSGSYSLVLIYSVIDPDYGKVEIGTTSAIEVAVNAGQSTPADFSAATLTVADDDNDGTSNLDELILGANPSDNGCIVGSSNVGSCTL